MILAERIAVAAADDDVLDLVVRADIVERPLPPIALRADVLLADALGVEVRTDVGLV